MRDWLMAVLVAAPILTPPPAATPPPPPPSASTVILGAEGGCGTLVVSVLIYNNTTIANPLPRSIGRLSLDAGNRSYSVVLRPLHPNANTIIEPGQFAYDFYVGEIPADTVGKVALVQRDPPVFDREVDLIFHIDKSKPCPWLGPEGNPYPR